MCAKRTSRARSPLRPGSRGSRCSLSLILGAFIQQIYNSLIWKHTLHIHTTWAGENQTQAGEWEILENSPQSGRSHAQSGRVGVLALVKMHRISEPVYSYLVLASVVHHLLVHDLIHKLESLQSLLLRDADVLLLQRHGTEAVVEEEEPLVWSHTHESQPRPGSLEAWRSGQPVARLPERSQYSEWSCSCHSIWIEVKIYHI